MQAFAGVVRQGKALYIGVSEWTAEQLRAGHELARDLGIHLISNQPHYSMTQCFNQVERWFGFITDELIRRGSHTSVQALEADIRACAEGWNEDPKPFIWTKPAEQILESIGRLLTRISGAAH
jgi:hypothetical protein